MWRSLMRNLILSSIVLSLLLCSCSKDLFKKSTSDLVQIHQSDLIKPIADDTSVIYKTAVNAYGRYLSGLLIIKSYSNDDYRMVFTTETGVKLFDFEFKKDEFFVHYCMDMLNKKPVINLLRNDFSLMLARSFVDKPVKKTTQDGLEYHFLKNDNELWFINPIGKSITNIKSTSLKGKTKLLITYSYNNSTIPSQIILVHKNLNLDMKLDMLIR
jgi:hypothetical protein